MQSRVSFKVLGQAAILAVLVLLAGAATYLLGGFSAVKPAVETTHRIQSLEATAVGRARLETLVALPWSESDAGVSQLRGESSLEAVFGDDHGGFYVVDHPLWHVGARVRHYSSSGRLQRRYLAPAGSTHFAARVDSPGFMYVIAKQQLPSEQIVLVDEAGAEKRFLVPNQLNSGALVWYRGILYVQAADSRIDVNTMEGVLREYLVPAVLNGYRQASDTESSAGRIEAWQVGMDGKLYQHKEEQRSDASRAQFFGAIGAKSLLELPLAAKEIGIDAHGRLWTFIPAATYFSYQDAPGWPANRDAVGEVLVLDLKGNIFSRFVVRDSPELVDTRVRMRLAADGLYVARAWRGGVEIVRYVQP